MQAGNGRTYTVTVTGSRGGDARYYVPRCYNGFGGNLNLDNINKKVSLVVVLAVVLRGRADHAGCIGGVYKQLSAHGSLSVGCTLHHSHSICKRDDMPQHFVSTDRLALIQTYKQTC